MKRLINVTLAIALAVGGILAGASAGKLLPLVGTILGTTPASAEGLTAQPAGPLVPSPVGSGFTYQGRLLMDGSPVTGSNDFTFKLYDEATSGALISGPISVTTAITNGLFTANLDFGAVAFNGDARYLEIATRRSGGGTFTTLSPRQPITPAPYALFALKTKGYKNVVTVARDGGNYTSVQVALNSITDNSATNRYLVWIAPGVYTETVTMKQYVDIEGSGEKTTTISQVGSSTESTGTLSGASNAELRSLTVRNTGSNYYALAIRNDAVGATMSLLHVTATASGATESSFGVYNINSSSPSMNNVTATASGPNYNSFGVYNINSSSPNMNNATATASGGNYSYGVANVSSSPSMNNVTATAWGGNYSYGVHNGNYSSPSSPNMNNVTATASGAVLNNYGVFNYKSAPSVIEGSVLSASGPGASYGLGSDANAGTYTIRINNSRITATTNTIRSMALYSIMVGGSQLQGGPVVPDGGLVMCAGTYDESYYFYANSCP